MRMVCHAGVLGNISHSETYLEQAAETHSSLLLRQRSSFLLSLSAHYDRLPNTSAFSGFLFPWLEVKVRARNVRACDSAPPISMS